MNNPLSRKSNCRFCEIVSGVKKYDAADSAFLECEDYIAIPSIGSFIEGWSLIIPKKHKLSLASDYMDSRFTEFAIQVVRHVESTYGKTILFEHGPATRGSPTGCGVDHAHLHIVPFENSLIKPLSLSQFEWLSCSIKDVSKFANDRDYLFYSDGFDAKNDAHGLLCTPEKPVSQYFRKVLAKEIGQPGCFDYNRYSFQEKAISTNEKLMEYA